MVKMVVKLINCTKEEQRSVIRFLVCREHKFISACVLSMGIKFSRRIIYEWIEMFENGRTSVMDAERSGRPATATTTRNEERTLEMIRENKNNS